MVLVDEKLLDFSPVLQQFQNKQNLQWNQPVEQSVKTSISNSLKTTLNDPIVPDDVKAKQYSHNLNRFLQTKRELKTDDIPPTSTTDDLLRFEPVKIEEGPTVDNLLDLSLKQPTVDELLDLPSKVKQKSKGTKSPERKLSLSHRKSSRSRKKSKKYADVEWEEW